MTADSFTTRPFRNRSPNLTEPISFGSNAAPAWSPRRNRTRTMPAPSWSGFARVVAQAKPDQDGAGIPGLRWLPREVDLDPVRMGAARTALGLEQPLLTWL